MTGLATSAAVHRALELSYNEGIRSETSKCRSLTFTQHTLTHTALTRSKGSAQLVFVGAN